MDRAPPHRRSELLRAGVVVCALAGAGVCLSCSSPFSSCEEQRTCAQEPGSAQDGSGGNAGAKQSAAQGGVNLGQAGDESHGESGAAGGGASGMPDCLDDADCSDALACNGLEECVDGHCQPGSPPCTNPDPSHCDVACSEGEDGADCAVTGQDLDSDQHLSASCAEAPGDDCNDDEGTVYLGATELCDQVDNDCDDKIDLDDGLTLSGGSLPFVTLSGASESLSGPAAAFAPNNEVFAVVWQEKNAGVSPATVLTRFAALDYGATHPADNSTLDSATTVDGGIPGTPDLAWGGSTFGAVWTTEHATADRVSFRTVDTVGSLFSLVQPKSSGTTLSIFPRVSHLKGTWITSWIQGTGDTDRSLMARPIDEANVLGTPQSLLPGAFRLNTGLAANDQVVVAKSDVNGGLGQYTLRTPELAFVETTPFEGESSVIAGGAAGFGLAYLAAPLYAATFLALGPDGSLKCGPVPLTGIVGQFWDMIATDRGYLLLIGLGNNSLLLEIRDDCTFGSPIFMADAAIGGGASIAGNTSTGFLAVWTLPEFKSIRFRMFGPNFCD